MWNRTWYRKCVLCGAFTLLFGLASAGQVQAQAGVFLKRTATFSQTASAVATFIINGPKADNDTTTIWLEFGSDDMGVALPVPFNGVTFQLQKTGTAAPLSLTNGLDNPAYGDKRIQFADENSSAGAPRVLRLDIPHYDATGVAIQAGSFETWMLTISLPSAISPLVRFIAYPIDAAVQFTALTPTGPCTAASFPVNVAVTTPAAGSVRFEATVPSGAPTGLTYQWTAEGDASAARGMASGNILTRFQLRGTMIRFPTWFPKPRVMRTLPITSRTASAPTPSG